MLEPLSESAARFRRYFHRRFRQAALALESDSSLLAEALIELEELIVEEAQIGRWRLPRLQETLSRLTEPL